MKRFFYVSFLAIIICFSSCDKKSDVTNTDNLFKYKEYISYNTYGNKSIAAPIKIELAQTLDQFELTQELPSEYLKISPKVKGKLIIENGRILLFQPDELLTPNTEFTITLKLEALYEDLEKEFKEYTFSFKTIKPNFKLKLANLQSYSKEWQYVTGTIETSDIVALDKVKQFVTAQQIDNTLKIKWPTETESSTFFEFTIDSIQRKVDDSKIAIAWNGKSINSDYSGKNTFDVPGQNNFKVIEAKSNVTTQSSLALNFSDPLEENQNFSGLVSLEQSERLRFEVDGNVLNIYPANRIIGNVRVTVFSGIKNTSGFKLKNEFSELISFEQLKPALKQITTDGVLPNATTTPIYFEAVNISAVDVRVIKIFEDNMLQYLQTNNLGDAGNNIRRVGRRVAKKTIQLQDKEIGSNGLWKSYGINISEYFKADPGALYRVELSFKKEYAMYDCSVAAPIQENDDEDYYYDDYYDEDYSGSYADAGSADEDEREELYWDNELYNYRNNTYNWRERENPCHEAYYNQNKEISTTLLGSDLGFIVKKGSNKSYHFATTNLISAAPEGNVLIHLFNYQQQLIGTATTDNNGLALFDSEKSFTFAVAQKGNNYAYAKLEDGNALSLSKFDVSGKTLQKGLKGFLYTERGVYRPGDDIHLTFVLNDKTNPLPKDHPLKLEVTDAQGKLVQRTVLKNNSQTKEANGFYYFPIETEAAAPTGNWNATISVGGASFSKNIKIATIKPNRLKLKLDFDDEILDASKPVKGTAQALWLHGAPARNLKIEMNATLRSSYASFKDFTNYNFNDPVRTFNEVEIPVLDSELTNEGTTQFSKKFEISDKAPGMLTATFLTKVFEGGGDFSIDVFTKKLARYSHFVGLKSPKPHGYGSYFTDENTVFDVATVDAQGKASGNREVEIKVFKIEWRWWWNRGNDNLSRYENARVHTPVKDFTVKTISNGKTNFTLNIPEKDGGRYLIRVIDKASGHATGRITYFYRNWSNRPASTDAESAKMLVFSADKETYDVGEKAKISFPSGSEGHALISVENGTEVLSTQWVKTNKGETQVEIPMTKEMTPNIFVNISLLQPYEQTKNDLPIRLYGVIPILVEDPSTILKPQLKMPAVLKPEEKFTINVSEENNKPMTYTIAVVDEGLLDLTRFKTPEIHDAFFTREALGVKTFDIFDDVIGAYSGSIENIFAIGGGDEAAGAKNRKADRFKPVVKYIGPFQLKAGENASHHITMPNYIGSVKTMLIAGDNTKNAYGNTDNVTPVRKPLMVLASLPRKLSPGETVTLPVTVFAMEKKVKNAKITVNVGDALQPIGGTSKSISFSEPGEQIVNFQFKVLPATKFQTIEVLASGSGETASYKLEIDVENPNPISQKTTQFVVSEKGNQEISFETYGMAGTNEAILEFSTLPPMDFSKRLGYLIRYPHGCIEQTTSGAFPQLYLNDIFDITFDKKKEVEENMKAAIKRLGNFQTVGGGLSYWPGERDADEWGTNYAGHFMLEAKQKGYSLPITFMSGWLKFQRKEAKQWRHNGTSYNSSLTQAYRLYTLALAGQPELAAMNRLRESNKLSNDGKWRLAAAYALAGKKSVAEEIAKTANINFIPKKYDYHTYGSPFRNKAMALETMVAIGDPKQRELAISVAKELSSQNWYSTQETAYGLLAMGKMVQENGGKSLDVSFTNNGKTTSVTTNRALSQRETPAKMGSNIVTITNKKGNVVYVTLSQKGKFPLGQETTESRNLTLKTKYLDGNGKKLDISQLKQGTEITAIVTVTNTSNDYVDNIALSQIFPSGWEVVNTSFTELGGGASGIARYTDIRDDRVNFYFDLGGKDAKAFTVKLNASYLGAYYLPGAQTEAMYDNNYYARQKGQWVSVEK